MEPIRVAVNGALGRMGGEIIHALSHTEDLVPEGGVDVRAEAEGYPLPVGDGRIPLARSLKDLLLRCRPHVVVDFSQAEATLPLAREAAKHGLHLVIGTTGLPPSAIQEIQGLSRTHQIGAIVCSNFAIGAVVLMHLARKAAPLFDYAEIIELHHEKKIDAPSGTAVTTAREMVAARGEPFKLAPTEKETLAGPRGAQWQGVAIHSVRLPGLLAHQEVIFGGLGQTLTLRHDTISRESFLPGILLAIREVVKRPTFVLGLETLLGLEGK